MELLLRFYEPEEGEILCNGENIKVLKLSEYRSLFSVVSQKSALFLGDIVQNIDLEGKADRQKLNEVLRKSGVKKYLQRFPEKEKTQIWSISVRRRKTKACGCTGTIERCAGYAF